MLRFFGLEPSNGIIEAVRDNDLKTFETLIKENKDPNQKDSNGNGPLHIAIMKRHDSIVHVLINHPKIKINSANKVGFTPLHLAVIQNKSDLCEQLTRLGAKLNARTNAGYTSFYLASIPSRYLIAIHLLNVGANYRMPDNAYITPMYVAALHGNRKLIEALLAFGADPSSKANFDFSPRYGASYNLHFDIANLIERHLYQKRIQHLNAQRPPMVQNLRSEELATQTQPIKEESKGIKRGVFEIESEPVKQECKRFKSFF
ncbi:MAG: ankyrin repeat domain-containing protein [Gammaproteobacteria bacterium]|nr:ankyrin repeat domain-containing protein [Gammaproteobacteria bacterium]